jgi:hypothetical protein
MITSNDIAVMESLASHPTLSQFISAQDWTAVAMWYESVPSPTLDAIISYMSPLDRHKYFQYVDFQVWYSQFNLKLHQGTALEVMGYNLAQISQFSTLLLIELISYSLTSQSMQDLVTYMFRRKVFTALYYFLVCLGSDGVFEPTTLQLYAIELSPTPRWQTLGLSEAPTYSECLDVYT